MPSKNSRAKGRRLDGYYPEYVLFDIETTGLSPVYDEIIELSAVKVKDGNIIDTFDTLIRPDRKIPRSATAVNGITNDMVRMRRHWNRKCPIFWNLSEDTNWLDIISILLIRILFMMRHLVYVVYRSVMTMWILCTWQGGACHSLIITGWEMSVIILGLVQKEHTERLMTAL